MQSMNTSFIQQLSNFWPAVYLSVGFPLVMLVLNEFINICDRRGLAIGRTLRTVRNLVVPSLAALLFARCVLELSDQATSMRVISTAFWVFLLYAVLGVVNDLIFATAINGSWRERMPKLFADLARVALVAIGAMVIYSKVWGREIQGVLTALGVGSVVIGLALQEPLGNIVSGLMLLFERPLKVGDWVSAEGVTGKVIEINWRSVHIQTTTRELRIVPNVRLYKGAFSNLSRPTEVRTEALQVGFSYDDPPNKVKQILNELLKTTEGVLVDPAPAVRTVDYSDWSVLYRITFSVARQEDLAATRDRFMTRLWYVVRREGLTIPFPIQMEYSPGENPGAPAASPQEWLRDFPRFRQVVKHEVTKPAKIVDYAAGEGIQGEGKHFNGFALVLRGRARLFASGRGGELIQVGEIGPGECFGDQISSGMAASDLTVVAVEDLKVMIFENKTMSELFNQSPALAAEVGDAIEARRRACWSAKYGSVTGAASG
jgi:small-conductance mechanosensitive channel